METPDHYFTAAPASADERRRTAVRLAGREVEVEVAPGIFSPGGLDKGTAVLLDEAPEPPATGTFLDLGCGWGPITLSLARDNAKALGVNDFHAVTPDEVPADIRFDAIWSNPPIRVGKAALHDLLRKWLVRLAPGGTAYLVVQKNLGSDSLQRWLATELEDTEPGAFVVGRHTTARTFRVLSVHRTEA